VEKKKGFLLGVNTPAKLKVVKENVLVSLGLMGKKRILVHRV
jgi:hypothetical protein